MDKKNLMSNSYKSRKLVSKIIEKITKKIFDENYAYFTSLVVSWIINDGNVFMYSNNETVKNNQLYKYYDQDSFSTFFNMWKNYFSSEEKNENLNEKFIKNIDEKKIIF